MRIATSFIASLATADFQRAQTALFEAQQQAGSEHKASDLRGYEKDAAALVSANGLLARSESYLSTGQELISRLNIQDLALGRAADAAVTLKTTLTDAIGLDRGEEIGDALGQAFFDALGAMSATYAGKYVFSGVRDDTDPVNINTLDELEAAGAASVIFDNAPRKATAQLDPQSKLEIAPLAQDVAEPFFESMRRIKAFITANGPFAGQLTAAQRTFLESEVQQLDQIGKGLVEQQSLNGGVQQRAQSLIDRQADESTYLQTLVADIQNADLAEVASRISKAQLQLEASARVFSVLNQASLLNYLS